MQWMFRCLLLVLATLHSVVGASELAEQLRSGNHVLRCQSVAAPRATSGVLVPVQRS